MVPFREAALRIVQLFISLLEGDSKKKMIVSNKKRFQGEYGSDPEERPPNLKRPEDYEAVFVGNIDDHFRIGNFCLSGPGSCGTCGVRVYVAGDWEPRIRCSLSGSLAQPPSNSCSSETSCLPLAGGAERVSGPKQQVHVRL